ncbi:hypothetical protein APV28_0274 [Comamonas testosteroni]|nr:hypothetical protein APV28_0274 [Comamonas testosteroni]
MIFIHGPLQTGVANVYGQKCHAADYLHFSLCQTEACHIHYKCAGNCQRKRSVHVLQEIISISR